jgi:hypothetical protein
LRWWIEDLRRRPVREGNVTVNVPPDGVRWAVTLYGIILDPGPYRLRVKLDDATGRELGHNQFDFRIESPKEQQ